MGSRGGVSRSRGMRLSGSRSHGKQLRKSPRLRFRGHGGTRAAETCALCGKGAHLRETQRGSETEMKIPGPLCL